MVTSSEDGTVKIWDTRTASVQRNYSHGSPVNDVVIHPNQGELISCDRAGNVRVWDLGENKCTHQLIPEEDTSVTSVTVATDGTLLCAGNNNVCGDDILWFLLTKNRAMCIFGKCSNKAMLLLWYQLHLSRLTQHTSLESYYPPMSVISQLARPITMLEFGL